jgi:hypothetical protein
MPLEMNIQQQGTEEFQAALDLLHKLGAKIYGAELMDSPRLDSDARNTSIIEFLSGANRDMFSLGRDEAKVLETVTKKITEGVQKAMDKQKTGGLSGTVSQQQANNIMGRVLKNGLKLHIKKAVLERIERNTNADGSAAAPVESEYSGWRSQKYGIPDDPTQVGVASGQLLDALAKGTIRLKSGR